MGKHQDYAADFQFATCVLFLFLTVATLLGGAWPLSLIFLFGFVLMAASRAEGGT